MCYLCPCGQDHDRNNQLKALTSPAHPTVKIHSHPIYDNINDNWSAFAPCNNNKHSIQLLCFAGQLSRRNIGSRQLEMPVSLCFIICRLLPIYVQSPLDNNIIDLKSNVLSSFLRWWPQICGRGTP